MLRRLLLIALFLLAQAGALAHGLEHALEPEHADEPVCVQCLAFAPMGAGVASTPPLLAIPTFPPVFETRPFVLALTRFRPIYQSRAPPRTC